MWSSLECGRQPQNKIQPYKQYKETPSSLLFHNGTLPKSFLYPYLYLFNLLFLPPSSSSFFLSFSSSSSLSSPSMADAGSVSHKRMSCSIPERFQLHAAMLALQFGYAGFHVVSRAALNMGISKLVFPVYRNVIALLLLLPFAYFIEK